jgi:Tol biopolymer transport system component
MLPPHARLAASLLGSGIVIVQSACGGAAAPILPEGGAPGGSVGAIVVKVEGLGNSQDADGFTAWLDGSAQRTLSYGQSVRYESLRPGDHVVRVADVAPHCKASRDSVTERVRAGTTDTLQIEMTCLGGVAYHEYVSDGWYDIVYLNEQGRRIHLATEPGMKFIAAWSPDGDRLLYEHVDGNGGSHLYSVRSDGTDRRELTSGSGTEHRPRWSPDGSRVAFAKHDYSTSQSRWIVTMNPDASDPRVLIDTLGFDLDPVWSTDGTRLYFGCNRFGRAADLCSAATDGSDLRSIRYPETEPFATSCGALCPIAPDHFETSPDGSRILFEIFETQQGPQTVWIGQLDGSSATSASGATTSFAGRWSPSGDRVLLGVFDGTSNFALATVNRDGTGYRRITDFADNDEGGTWSPDGALIAFDGFESGAQQLWVMNADGTGRHQLTDGSLPSFAPLWNPKARPPQRVVASSSPASPSGIASRPSRSPGVALRTRLAAPARLTTCVIVRENGGSRIDCPATRLR